MRSHRLDEKRRAWIHFAGFETLSAVALSYDVTARPLGGYVRLAIVCVIAFSCHAQVIDLLGRPIVDVKYSPAEILHPADLQRVQILTKGAVLRREDVAEAIDRLFAT